MLFSAVPEAKPLVIAVLVGADHEYVVPVGTMEVVGETVNVCPLQMVAVPAEMEGVGFNVMVTLKGAPGQDPEVGVTL
jgi:hypothetical protein